MKNTWLKFIVIICIGTIASEGFCFDYPGDNSIGKATIPQASTSGLIRKPQINYGTIGDLVVTGSLPNGNYFQGIIPYNSTSELSILEGTINSSLLNSGSIGSTGLFYPDSSSPFQSRFSPAPTTTSLNRAQISSRLMPPQMQFSGETGNSKLRSTSSLNAAFKDYYTQSRPLTAEVSELETALAEQRQLRKFQQDIDRVLKEESLFNKDTLTIEESKKIKDDFSETKLWQHFKPPQPPEPDKPQTIEEVPKDYADIHEQMQKELDKEAEKLLEEKPAEKEKKPEDAAPGKDLLKDAEPDEKGYFGKWMKIGRAEHEKVLNILGPHKTYKSFAAAKYGEYTLRAKMFLKEGRYYKAADMYTLAAIYDRENASILARKAIALFAAGEYMSASFFLSKSLLLSPEHASQKIDLANFLPGRDVIDDRLVEMDQCLQKSGSGELSFLMAYIHYNLGNTPKAIQHINEAAVEMAESQAVKSLKKTITDTK